MAPELHGIIFDFNGVLLWDSHLHERAWQAFALEKRGRPFTAEELKNHMHGRTNAEILGYLYGRPVAGAELAQYVEEKESAYQQMCLQAGDEFQLSPGAVELLDWLQTAEIPHTIATSSDKGNVDFFWQHLDLARWFAYDRLVYDDGSIPGKPAPHMYLRAAAQLALPPARCIVVEDSISGIQAAAAAGMGCVVALGVEKIAEEAVDLQIRTLQELPRALFAEPD
jgi:beta-phosphoglucomutase